MASNSQKPITRRWLRVSLRTLLVLVTLTCICLAVFFNRVRRQARAVEAITAAGGRVTYDYQFATGSKPYDPPPGPAWLRSIVGDHCFQTPQDVELRGDQVDDVFLQTHLRGISRVQSLLIESPQVTDVGISAVVRMRSVDLLSLKVPQLTDTGVGELARMDRLTALTLDCPRISDAGLKSLAELESLQEITLNSPRITAAGIEPLKKLQNVNYVISIRDTQKYIPNYFAFRALESTVPIDFREVPMSDAIQFLVDCANHPINLDGVPTEKLTALITKAESSLSLAGVLDAILEPLELDYYLDAGHIVIAPREQAAPRRVGYRAFREAFRDGTKIDVDW